MGEEVDGATVLAKALKDQVRFFHVFTISILEEMTEDTFDCFRVSNMLLE